ncbi:protein LTO1 homolog [Wyeomyia smithii]|uniref:protein LTO1 homolog n=1 Tax=Wyeomyia smithii TaxID=174621 RepID=UPI0024681B6F|nr:protein LTO1 homolog [Wyeomyia smithii]
MFVIMTDESNSAKASAEVDINEVFDNLLLSEERLAEESFKQGVEVGTAEGNVDAYHFGYHRGAEIGSELGFYYGVIGAQENDPCEVSPKAKALLKELISEIEEFPKFNDLEVDFLARLLLIRNKYKKLCALLKISAKYQQSANELSF